VFLHIRATFFNDFDRDCTISYRKSRDTFSETLIIPTPPSSKISYCISEFTYTPKMPSKPKTARREHSSETIAVILALDSLGYSIRDIRKENGLPKSTIHGIIRRAIRNAESPHRKARRTGRPPKLDVRAERRLIRFVGLNPFETIACYSTPSKTGYRIHLNTTRRYLQKNEIYAFRPRKKPYLSKAHKRFRLKWAKEYQF
jgi:transposase